MADTTTRTFPLTVRYDRTIEESIVAGKYDFVSPNINDRFFTNTRQGESQLEAVLVKFNGFIAPNNIVSELNRLGLRAGELHELLDFGEQYPQAQRKHPIVAAGNPAAINENYFVPYLSERGGERALVTGVWGNGNWKGYNYFLAFSK